MSDPRNERVRELFDIAVTIAPEYRHDWLVASSPDDPVMVETVERLLASHDHSAGPPPLSVPEEFRQAWAEPPAQAQPSSSSWEAPTVASTGGGGFSGPSSAPRSDSFPPGLYPPSPAPSYSPVAPLEMDVGSMIGVYKLVKKLGEGGMGAVYQAIRDDDVFQKVVALKVIRDDRADAEFIARFREERQLLAKLDHPNIARIIDGGSTPEGMPYYVMDYVEGQPLDAYCKTNKLHINDKLGVFRQICAAVQYLHENRVIHRDLKPANIMVSTDGTVKLLDFGIAKVQGPGQAVLTVMTATGGGRIMTPAYASPEQIHGAPVEAPSDIYALGVILYEMLTGNRPYADAGDGTSKMAALAAGIDPLKPSANVSQDRAVEPVFDVRKRLTGDLDYIILMTLRIVPSQRYPSAAALSEDIRRYLDNQPILARPTGAGERMAKFIKRKPMVVTAVAAIVLLAGFGGWAGFSAYRQGNRAKEKELQIAQLLNAISQRLEAPNSSPEQVGEDVKKIQEVFRTDLPEILALQPGVTDTRKELAKRSLEVLAKAQQRAGENTGVSEQIADAYQAVGDLQSSTTNGKQKGFGDPEAAKASYRSSGAVLQNLTAKAPDDPNLKQRLTTVEGRLTALGGKLLPGPIKPPPENRPPPPETTVTPVTQERAKAAVVKQKGQLPVPPVGGAGAQPAPSAVTPAPAPAPAPAAVPPADTAALRELRQRYNTVGAQVASAEAKWDDVRKNLTAKGQVLNGSISSALGRMKANLQTAKEEIAQRDLEGAKESLDRAEADAIKLLRQ